MFYGLIWENVNGYDTALPRLERERYKMLIGPENGYIDPFWSPFFYRYVCMKMTLQGGKSHCEKEFSKTKAGQEIFTLSQVSGRGAVFIGGWDIVLEST